MSWYESFMRADTSVFVCKRKREREYNTRSLTWPKCVARVSVNARSADCFLIIFAMVLVHLH